MVLHYVDAIAPPPMVVQPLLTFSSIYRLYVYSNSDIYTFPVRRHANPECAFLLYVFASDLVPRADILVRLNLRLAMCTYTALLETVPSGFKLSCFAHIERWNTRSTTRLD